MLSGPWRPTMRPTSGQPKANAGQLDSKTTLWQALGLVAIVHDWGVDMKCSRTEMSGIAKFAYAIAVAWLATGSGAQSQDAKMKVGTLTCLGKGGVGLILGSKERLDCTYSPSSGGGDRRFDGTITRIGLDIGIKGKSVIVWGVMSSTSALPGDSLGGEFAGVAADASLGLGAGAQVLVGGNKKSVVLQPLSVKGETGLNLAVGVAGLTLVPSL